MANLNHVLLREDIRVGADLDAWLARGGGEGSPTPRVTSPRSFRPSRRQACAAWAAPARATHRKGSGRGRTVRRQVHRLQATKTSPARSRIATCSSNTPHEVIEGALIAATATHANHVVLYVNPHLERALAIVREAVQQWRGTHCSRRWNACSAAPSRSWSWPARACTSVARKRRSSRASRVAFPFPRRKPPFPAQQEAHGAPTVINNTETLAHVPGILRHGAPWYRGLGIGQASGTKLYSLSGDVLRPGLYELPMGTRLEELVFEHGGRMLQGKEFKAVFTGGPSNTLLSKR